MEGSTQEDVVQVMEQHSPLCQGHGSWGHIHPGANPAAAT